MAVESDLVAIDVADAVARGLVVTLRGWVVVNGDKARVFTEPWFSASVELDTARVVHQVAGSERSHDEGRSALWVEAGAPATKLVDGEAPAQGTASDFAEEGLPFDAATPVAKPGEAFGFHRRHWPW